MLELVVQIADEGVAAQQVLVGLPLVEDLVPPGGGADGVEHVAVALAVHTLLKGLDGQAEVHLVGGDVLADAGQVCGLDGIEKHEKAEDLVVGGALGGGEAGIVLHVLGEVDLFRDPEIVHGLPVPAAHPGVAQIVEVVQVGGVAADHAAQADVCVAAGVEQGLFYKLCHSAGSLPFKTSSSRILPLPAICCGCNRWS